MEHTIERISKRIIELNNIRFDKTGEWTPNLQQEYDRLTAERQMIMGRKFQRFVLK